MPELLRLSLTLGGIVFSEWGRRLSSSSDWLAGTIGLLLSLGYFWPGFMSFDSVDQLSQAQSGIFQDWHPPSMALLWGVLGRVSSFSPAPMLVLQLSLYWFALVLLYRNFYFRPLQRCFLVLLTGFYPPLFLHSGVIWKDVQMAVFLLFAFSLLSAEKVGRLKFVAAAVCFAYATSVRHNSIPACLPLLALLISTKLDLKPVKLWTLACLVSVAVFFMTTLFFNNYSAAERRYPIQQIFIHDLVAISIKENQYLLPAYLSSEKWRTIEYLKRIYTPREIVPLFCCDTDPVRLPLSRSASEIEQLGLTWLSAVTTYPQSYLSHRFMVLGHLLGFGDSYCLPFYSGIMPNDLGIELPINSLRDRAMRVFSSIKSSLIFSAWPYIIILICQLAITPKYCVRRRMLSLSGILYFIPYLGLATTCDLRMSLWPMLAAIIGLTLSLGDKSG